jgi:hypothetical protein
MRLEDSHQPAIGPHQAGCAQGGIDFGRMMTVIIDNGNPARFTLHFESPVDATEVVQRLSNTDKGDIQFHPCSDRSQGITNVVQARNIQHDRAQIFAMPHDNKHTAESLRSNLARRVIHVTMQAVGEHLFG